MMNSNTERNRTELTRSGVESTSSVATENLMHDTNLVQYCY